MNLYTAITATLLHYHAKNKCVPNARLVGCFFNPISSSRSASLAEYSLESMIQPGGRRTDEANALMLISTSVHGKHIFLEMVEKILERTDLAGESFESRGWADLPAILSVDWGSHGARSLEEKRELKDG